MKIANEFTVSAPIDKAWSLLNDLEQVIPLMPGAQMTGREDDHVLGKVKIKVGPVNSEFNGKVRFVEQDDAGYRAVIDAKGKEARGTGNAAATVTAQLREEGDVTRVVVDTDLKIVGKLAQFGSGMLQQVSEKLLGQFVESLEVKLAADNAPAAAPAPERVAEPSVLTAVPSAVGATTPAPVAAPVSSPEPEPIDLLELAGGTALTRYLPAVAAAVALVVLGWLAGRRSARRCG